jgi:hypothetical protein
MSFKSWIFYDIYIIKLTQDRLLIFYVAKKKLPCINFQFYNTPMDTLESLYFKIILMKSIMLNMIFHYSIVWSHFQLQVLYIFESLEDRRLLRLDKTMEYVYTYTDIALLLLLLAL